MILLQAVAPLIIASTILGFTRLPGWVAGLAALLATLPALLASLPTDAHATQYLADATFKGLWLAWQAVSVMCAGLFFHAATRPRRASPDGETALRTSDLSEAELFTLVFFIGPFIESAVGFGVGIVVVLERLRACGVAPLSAALLSLLSQTLVPWGAFSVGTLIGAEIANLGFTELGFASALLSLPLLLGWLPFYWRLVGQANRPSTNRASDIVWVLSACVLLIAANRMVDPQIAAVSALGVIIGLRRVLYRRTTTTLIRDDLLAIWPYIALCSVLLTTRLIPTLGQWLRSIGAVQPEPDQLIWYPFYHPRLLAAGVWHGLSCVATACVAFGGRKSGAGKLSPGAGHRAVRDAGAVDDHRWQCACDRECSVSVTRRVHRDHQPAAGRFFRIPHRQQCRVECHDDALAVGHDHHRRHLHTVRSSRAECQRQRHDGTVSRANRVCQFAGWRDGDRASALSPCRAVCLPSAGDPDRTVYRCEPRRHLMVKRCIVLGRI